jgi:nucleoside-diphosphate kinase
METSAFKTVLAETKIPMTGIPGTKHERTFLMVKPDGVQRELVGEIIKRMETKGYKLVAIKMIEPDEKLVKAHYADLKDRPFFGGLIKYFSSNGPVVAMVWEGAQVINYSRKLIGKTNPLDSEPGTIRGDLAVNVGRNVIHGSDGVEGAQAEIPLWFKESEVITWTSSNDKWAYDK